jgi:tRNA(Ile)-lysidine synthase TilS/MesJ
VGELVGLNCSCAALAISERGLCEEHFLAWFRESVLRTVDEWSMIAPGERVLVAASGGKDSLTLLDILSERYDCTALCIDEGLAGYREHSIEDLKRFCEDRGVRLVLKTFKEERGYTMDEAQPVHPCTTCGIGRRTIMASVAKDYDVIATGHNLDDEAQAIMMNIMKHHAMKPRPVLQGTAEFTRRVKPLYFMHEADVRRYAYLRNLVTTYAECRNAARSHRRAIQGFLENRERESPGAKERLVKKYLSWLDQ